HGAECMFVKIMKLDDCGEIPVMQRNVFLLSSRDMCLTGAVRQTGIYQGMDKLAVLFPCNTEVGATLQQAHGYGFAGMYQAMKQSRVDRFLRFYGGNISMR